MNLINKLAAVICVILTISACDNKKNDPATKPSTPVDADTITLQVNNNQESIAGIYKTQHEADNSDDCDISVEITKVKDGYIYFLKTKTRKIKGKVSITTEKSGEKYVTLDGIKWDEYEGDISDEDENDSISKTTSKKLEIPVGIDASYVKDTLTIENYGNSMNSYTKISECGRKYIQLIKK